MDIQINCKAENFKLVSTEKIIPNPQNRNKHSPEQIERLCKILQQTGFRQPLVISNLSGFLAAGHGRLSAAMALGMKLVPVVFQDFASPAEEYAFMTADNAIASWSELDLKGIGEDILDFGPDFDLELMGIKNFVLEPCDFKPASEDEQGKLDLKDFTKCPKCGEVFDHSEHRIKNG